MALRDLPSSAQRTYDYTLNAGFALRAAFGVDYDLGYRYGVFSGFRLGAEIQDLAFDCVFWPNVTGRSGRT